MKTTLKSSSQQPGASHRSAGSGPVRIPVRFPSQPVIRPAPRAQSDFSISAKPTSWPLLCCSVSQRFSLCNDSGFWELTFDGHSAVLKQHPALFYVAWLLANRPAQPLDALDLVSKIFEAFHGHPDLPYSMPNPMPGWQRFS